MLELQRFAALHSGCRCWLQRLCGNRIALLPLFALVSEQQRELLRVVWSDGRQFPDAVQGDAASWVAPSLYLSFASDALAAVGVSESGVASLSDTHGGGRNISFWEPQLPRHDCKGATQRTHAINGGAPEYVRREVARLNGVHISQYYNSGALRHLRYGDETLPTHLG